MIDTNKKKFLLVAAGGGFFTEPFIRALSLLGYESKAFDNRRGLIYTSSLTRALLNKVPRLKFLRTRTVNNINKQLLETVRAYKPQYMLCIKAENIHPETVQEIKSLGVTTLDFYHDMINQWDGIAEIAPAYDYFANQCHVVLRRLWGELNLKNCFYMAHSTEPLLEDELSKNKKYDISFIGTHNNQVYLNRERYLMAINDLNLHIWGNDGWANTPLKNHFMGRAYGDQRFDIYRDSKIVVDVNWDAWPCEGMSNRPFEVAGCGAMYMVDDARKGIDRAYAIGKEVVLFHDEKDFREKVQYYLAHDDEREKIALAGYRRTVADHTYINRVHQILDTLEYPEKYLYK